MHRKDFVVIPTDSPFDFLIIDIVNAMEKPYPKLVLHSTCPCPHTRLRRSEKEDTREVIEFSLLAKKLEVNNKNKKENFLSHIDP